MGGGTFIVFNLLFTVKYFTYVFPFHTSHIYSIDLEVNETTDTLKSASYLHFHLEINNGGRFKTKFHYKRDDFTFSIVNFP